MAPRGNICPPETPKGDIGAREPPEVRAAQRHSLPHERDASGTLGEKFVPIYSSSTKRYALK